MRFYFEEAAMWEAHVHEVLDEINRRGLPVVLFGRPKNTDPAFLKEIRVPIRHICCNTPTSWGGKFWGLDVVSPDEMQKLYRDYNVLILVTGKRYEIPSQLRQLPVPPAAIFELDLHWGIRDHHMPRDSAAYFQNVQSQAEMVYGRLADQQSKDTYEAVLRYRMNRDINVLAPVTVPIEQQYFPQNLGGKMFLGTQEIFVDAGAYTGDTVEGFLSAVHGAYRYIYAFEPEHQNYQTLLEHVGPLNDVTCFKCGVGDSTQELHISSAGSGSTVIADTNGECIQVDTLDRLIHGAPVTYIKMDIEGMECPALRGAKGLIQKYHPKLAICCYHSDEDMVMVPTQILKLDPSYRLYMRHYTYNLGDTVCYAI